MLKTWLFMRLAFTRMALPLAGCAAAPDDEGDEVAAEGPPPGSPPAGGGTS